jgi:hypothetical protein
MTKHNKDLPLLPNPYFDSNNDNNKLPELERAAKSYLLLIQRRASKPEPLPHHIKDYLQTRPAGVVIIDRQWTPPVTDRAYSDDNWLHLVLRYAQTLVAASSSLDDRLEAFVTIKGALRRAEGLLPRGSLRDAVIIILDAIRKCRLETLSQRQLNVIASCLRRLAQGRLDEKAVREIDSALYDAGLDWVMGD